MYQKRAKTLKDIYDMENRLFLKNTKNKNLISFDFKLLNKKPEYLMIPDKCFLRSGKK